MVSANWMRLLLEGDAPGEAPGEGLVAVVADDESELPLLGPEAQPARPAPSNKMERVTRARSLEMMMDQRPSPTCGRILAPAAQCRD